jgi:hypothetical protein
LEEVLQSHTRFASERAWLAVQNLLHRSPEAGRGPVEQARLQWVQQHAARIRPLVDAARQEHFLRYG